MPCAHSTEPGPCERCAREAATRDAPDPATQLTAAEGLATPPPAGRPLGETLAEPAAAYARSQPKLAGVDAPEQAPSGEHDSTLIRQQQPSSLGEEPAPLPAGAKVGRYVVLDVLGVGGMGILYTAYDPHLDRRVAIKLLRSGPTSDSRSSSGGATRLLREAQAMAQLAHPNVVPIYDVGAIGDSVFLAMELVTGVTLNVWEKQKDRTWREVLALFLTAGRGLQAAHDAGLVHRDFKPSNVLVGADGRARVTDFGLARSTRGGPDEPEPRPEESSISSLTPTSSLKTPITIIGAVMGSPGYMAPEQYAGAATSASTDQYAFCVSLYEALYGKRPFPGKDLDELGKATREGKVPPPPKGSTVPPWLFPVILRGLSPDPVARHPSMGALLDALARDPTVRRNRWLMLAGGVAAVASLSLGWGWLSHRTAQECRTTAQRLAAVWDDAARGRAQAAFDATGKSYAKVAWPHVRDAMDSYARSWISERTEACEATRVRGEQSERQLTLRLGCLDRRLDELATLANAFAAADAELAGQAGVAVTRLSPIASCANLHVLEERQRLAPEAREAVGALEQQLAQGRMLVAAGRYGPAREKIAPAVAQARALDVAAFEGEALEALGLLEQESGHYGESRDAFEGAARAALAAGDDQTAGRVLASLVSVVGWRLEHPEEGRHLGSIATGVVARAGGDARLTAQLDEGLGDAEWQAGDRPAALASYRKALVAMQQLDGESSDVARLHSSVGWVLIEQGLLQEARAELEQSRTLREQLLGSEHPSLGFTWNELGTLEVQLGDYAEALRCFERSGAIHGLALGQDSWAVHRAELNIAEALPFEDRAAEALPLVAKVEKAIDATPDAPVSHRMQAARARARAEAVLGHASDAVANAKTAVAIAEQRSGADHPDTAGCVEVLGEAFEAAGRHAEALQSFDRFLAMSEKLGATKVADYANGLVRSGAVLVALKRPADAVTRLDKAVALLDTLQGNARLRADARLGLAEALWFSKPDRTKARAMAAEARDGYAALKRPADAGKAAGWLTAHVR